MSSLSTLTGHLFDQLERLTKTDMTAEERAAEIERTDAIVKISDRITETANTQLKAAHLYASHGQAVLHMLPQIGKAVDK